MSCTHIPSCSYKQHSQIYLQKSMSRMSRTAAACCCCCAAGQAAQLKLFTKKNESYEPHCRSMLLLLCCWLVLNAQDGWGMLFFLLLSLSLTGVRCYLKCTASTAVIIVVCVVVHVVVSSLSLSLLSLFSFVAVVVVGMVVAPVVCCFFAFLAPFLCCIDLVVCHRRGCCLIVLF